jgi:hypothetical protein
MLYKIRDGVSVFDDNPELLAIPEFTKLLSTTHLVEDGARDRRMRYVILVADRRSPLRSLPEKARKEKAAQISGYGMEGNRLDKNARNLVSGAVEAVEQAISKYRELQYDENQDKLDSTNKLIRTNLTFIDSVNNRTEEQKKDKQYGKDLELANKLSKQLPELEEAKQKLEQLLQITTEQKPEITTYTSLDLEGEETTSEENLSLIDQINNKGLLNGSKD